MRTLPREDRPQRWLTVDLASVARHVLIVRRRHLQRTIITMDSGMRHHRLFPEWQAFRQSFGQHLTLERKWMSGGSIPIQQVAAANQEHDRLLDQMTALKAKLESDSGEILRESIQALEHELEHQVYCEQVLLFPRLRAYRSGNQGSFPQIRNEVLISFGSP